MNCHTTISVGVVEGGGGVPLVRTVEPTPRPRPCPVIISPYGLVGLISSHTKAWKLQVTHKCVDWLHNLNRMGAGQRSQA